MTEHTSCRDAGTQSSLDPRSTALRSVAGCGQSPPSLHDAKTIMADIKIRLARGSSGENWKEYRLSVQEWANLKDLLAGCELYDKISYHYFSRTQTFVHQMQTVLHSMFSRLFSRLLLDALEKLCCETQESNRFQNEIVDIGDGDITARIGSDFHQPDGYFTLELEEGAGVVLEFAYAQKTKSLREVAQFYLLESCLKVQFVVGVDCDYANHTKKATLRTWKCDESDSAGGVKLREYVQELRSEDGTPIPGRDLQITMFDLAPPDRIPLSLRHATINLSVEDLCGIIRRAEVYYEARSQKMRSLKDTGNSSQPVPNSVETDARDADPSDSEHDHSSQQINRTYAPTSCTPPLLRSPIKT